ncbi:AmmeMemoRadiSam system protein B [Vitiosangium sp. GDMCC 1.1324]|uniref:AmmeMemoRadiSam system protein B n=1 Tax=Vitiosangium sp. (strain GDMCC 1.1324) TaxID=2138576 RepID=UPI000D3A4933|nr:AmmeMemoRadiSam system protein B [Vitiosangium sp. GDMCC 1.1324]PTL83749.1 AmmeMemoRadiSam system protein B [Vitiosangium sp. GDMCC 1.1324]
MARVRAPAVAGSFYPATAPLLAQQVDRWLEQAPACPSPLPVALIVPHAGYSYSGPVAARGHACLRGLRGRVRHVLLLGPCHFVLLNGLAHPDADALRTPLGDVLVDGTLRERAEATRYVAASSMAHRKEHSLEVQLPFLQRVLGDFDVLPLVVGTAPPEEVAEVLDALWTEDVLPIISSDLSHYLPYDTARKVDRETAERILRLQGPLEDDFACGAAAINGLLLVARRRGLRAELLDLRSSGDTAGDKQEVVGYGAFAFYPPSD